jgi:hypothetical protein
MFKRASWIAGGYAQRRLYALRRLYVQRRLEVMAA